MASSAPTIVAAAVGRARRRVVAHFLVQHAITAEDAVAYVPERRLERRLFEHMRRDRLIHDAGEGRYWLDLPAYNAHHARLHRRLVIVVIAASVVIAGALMLFYRG